MHQLILMRHAKAVRDHESETDHERGLTAEGRRAAGAMGGAMRGLGLAPDVVLVSSARRTQETLDALEPWADRPNLETLPALYMAPAAQIAEMLRQTKETVRSVLVLGHNPGLHELALALAGEQAAKAASPALARLREGFPTAALAEFLIAVPWGRLGHAGGAVLTRVLQPRDLPETAA